MGASRRAGVLFLKIKILPHRLYQLDGKDITLDLPVAPWEAALGAKVEAPTPSGRITLNIPAGSKGGNRLRLKGRGLPGKPPAPGRDPVGHLQVAMRAGVGPPAHERHAYICKALMCVGERGKISSVHGI